MSTVTQTEPDQDAAELATPQEGNNKIDRKFLQSLSLRSIIKRGNPQLYRLPSNFYLVIQENSLAICYERSKQLDELIPWIQTAGPWTKILKNFQNHRWRSPKKIGFSIETSEYEEFTRIIATQNCKHFNTVQNLRIRYCTTESLVNNISHKFSCLKHLYLPNLVGEITDENLKFLGSEISHHLVHLESLVIHFNNETQGDLRKESLGTLAARLFRSMRKLKYLYLQLGMFQGGVNGWRGRHFGQEWYRIFRYIDSSFKARLEKASFEISSNKGYSDSLLFDITKSPKNFVSRFNRDHPIDDPEIVAFLACVNFSSMINLRRLTLNLRECKDITDEGMSIFIGLLGKSLNQLDYLSLHFYSCVKIKDKTLKSTSENLIAELKNVPKMNLQFSSCPWLTEKEIKTFLLSITLNTTVQQEINIGFISCYRVAFEAKDELYSIAATIKGLKLMISQ